MSPHQVLDNLCPVTDVIITKNAFETLRLLPLCGLTDRGRFEKWGESFGGDFNFIGPSNFRGVDIIRERSDLFQQLHTSLRNEDLSESR
jgi:hypothetical protein